MRKGVHNKKKNPRERERERKTSQEEICPNSKTVQKPVSKLFGPSRVHLASMREATGSMVFRKGDLFVGRSLAPGDRRPATT